MTQIILENLDPFIVEQLKTRAQNHGRSLEAEVKAILQQVTGLATKPKLNEDDIIKRKSALILQQIEHHAQNTGKSVDSEINLPYRNEQELVAIKARLKELKKGMSLGGLSIREAREEGRRY